MKPHLIPTLCPVRDTFHLRGPVLQHQQLVWEMRRGTGCCGFLAGQELGTGTFPGVNQAEFAVTELIKLLGEFMQS